MEEHGQNKLPTPNRGQTRRACRRHAGSSETIDDTIPATNVRATVDGWPTVCKIFGRVDPHSTSVSMNLALCTAAAGVSEPVPVRVTGSALRLP
jgi:hypothetical protein